MSFRDFNSRSSKYRPYTDGNSFRDCNARPVRKIKVLEQNESPQKTVSNNIPLKPPQSQYINRPASQPVTNYQGSIYIPPKPYAKSTILPKSVPIQQPQQSQFLYYTQNNNTPVQQQPVHSPTKPVIPVPPQRPPEQEKTDPSKFVEEYVPTPPPKMVKAKIHTVHKPKNENVDFGGFGGTFDSDPDQSTPIADIPVMNNIDDYKI